MSNILVVSSEGYQYVVKRSDIRRVQATDKKKPEEGTTIFFTGTKNTPIKISGTVEEFYTVHWTK